MNKYQESLNKIKCMGEKDLWNERHLEWAGTLQELIDKYNELKSLLEEYNIDESNIRKMLMIANMFKEEAKTPTKEEIIKKWEELGFDYNEENDCGKKLIMLKRVDLKYTICIETETKEFGVYYDRFFTFEEYKLLTKTFKMLGWEV